MDTLGIIRQIEQDPALRSQLRAVLLGDELLELPDIVRQLASQVEALTAAQARTETELQRFIQETGRRFDRIESDLGELKADVRRLKNDVGELKGSKLELRVLADPGRYVPRRLAHGPRPLDAARRDALLAALAPDDAEDVERADGFVEARSPLDGRLVLFVLEISWNAHVHDVERAERRTRLLRDADFDAVGLVVSHAPPEPPVVEAARTRGVAVVSETDGLLVAMPPPAA